MTLLPGTTVGRYQILEPLGQGGMATVYKAFQPSLEREVALKVLRPGFAQDQEFRERFEREAKAIARLRHPHIVQVFDFEVSTSGEFVLAMEFLEGGTLKERVAGLAASGRGMDPAESLRILGEVAEALGYAHEKGIVHRDVKPANVMLTHKDRAVVTDFGIARILGATSHTQTGVGIGTPEYMAPEQGQGGKVDHRADIYSLGAMAYELLTGRVPYTADTPLAVVIAHIKDPLPLPSKVNPTIGKGVEKALLKALAKDPSQRFDSATAFAEALRAGLAEDTKGGTIPTVVVRAGASAPSVRAAAAPAKPVTIALPPVLAQRPVVLAVAGALALAVVVGGVVASNAFRASPEPASAPTAAPTQAVSPTLAPLTAIPKGRLVWEAKLDGATNDIAFQDVGPPPNAKPGDVDVRQVKGAIEVTIRTANIGAGIYPNTTARGTYVFEMDAVATSGSLTVYMRTSPTAGYPRIGARLGATTQITYQESASAAQEALTPPRAAEITNGSPFTATFVAEETRYSVFVGGKLVAQAVDARMNGDYVPRIFYSGPAGATFRMTGLRTYEIGSSAAAAAPTLAAGGPKKGPLMYAAKLDGTSSDVKQVSRFGDTNASQIKYVAGAIEIGAVAPNGDLWASLEAPPLPSAYVAEIGLAFLPGSSGRFRVILRELDDGSSYILSVDGPRQSVQVVHGSATGEQSLALRAAPSLSRPSVTLTVASEPSRFTAFIDGEEVARVDGVATTSKTLNANLNFTGSSGGVRVTAVRYFEAVLPPAALPQTVPARGQLLYEARLDGKGTDLVDPAVEGVITQGVGAIELRGSSTNQLAPGHLNLEPRTSYILELALAVEPGSTVEFRSMLKGDGGVSEYFLRVSPRNRALDLLYLNRTRTPQEETLTPRIPVPALVSGETFWVAVVVEDGRLTLFLDQQQVAQVSDRRITQASTPHIRVWAGNTATGVVRVVAARVYALP